MKTRSAPTRLLDEITSTWTARGWDPAVLASFRMEADGDEGSGGGDGGGGDAAGGSSDGDGEGGNPDPKDAEIEKWKSLARKHEERAKSNSGAAKELEELRKTHMSDQEKAVAEAREAGKLEVLSGVGGRLVSAEFRAQAAAAKVSDTARDALVENLDLTKFLTDDGDVDTDKVKALIEGIAPKPDTGDDGKDGNGKGGDFPNIGQGRRGGDGAKPSVATGRDLYAERHAKKKS